MLKDGVGYDNQWPRRVARGIVWTNRGHMTCPVRFGLALSLDISVDFVV